VQPRGPWERPQISGDLEDDAVLALNNANAAETSPLTLEALRALRSQAFFAAGVDRGAAAFVIALDESADHDNPNFAWFRARFRDFVYIDRVVTAREERGRGLARELYKQLLVVATAAGRRWLVCEINADPPNLVSQAFHDGFGFEVVGRGVVAAQNKLVDYLAMRLPPTPGGTRRPG
jgi:predicted GNAT superfamily acetyltransferase